MGYVGMRRDFSALPTQLSFVYSGWFFDIWTALLIGSGLCGMLVFYVTRWRPNLMEMSREIFSVESFASRNFLPYLFTLGAIISTEMLIWLLSV